jgi:hypothetical protein
MNPTIRPTSRKNTKPPKGPQDHLRQKDAQPNEPDTFMVIRKIVVVHRRQACLAWTLLFLSA